VQKKVKIPFKPEMAELSLQGKKHMTTRTRKYGDEGDTFEINGVPFAIMGVGNIPLHRVANKLFESEGFSSREEFIDYWNKLHPRKKYDPDQMVWIHSYMKVEELGKSTLL
jgi:hypothetical protein